MALAPDTKLGPYEILCALGAGGMGEVYRARDPRLGREVAIKVLPSGSAPDSERLRRFEQEARATAALNHTNILAVFDIGSQDNSPYIAILPCRLRIRYHVFYHIRLATRSPARTPGAEGTLLKLSNIWRKRVRVERTGDGVDPPPAGFEDREVHRNPCASIL